MTSVGTLNRQDRRRPARVALFLDRFPRLSETFIAGQAAALLEAGIDVYILADRPTRTEAPAIVRTELAGRTHYRRAIPSSRVARIAETAALAGGCAFRSGLFPARWSLWALRRLKSGRGSRVRPVFDFPPPGVPRVFDAVVCHFGPIGARAVDLRVLAGMRGPIATVFHGYDVSRWVREHGVDVYRDLFARGDWFLPVSTYWQRRLVELGCPEKRCTVVHVGVDTQRLAFRLTRRSPGAPLRILSVARLVEKKGLQYALRAVARLNDLGVRVDYRIVGDGPLCQSLQRLCRELALCDKVTFLGPQPPDSVAALLGDSDVLMAPSVTAGSGDEEGIPVVLMEAMAVGVPVVTTRHSGIPELVRDGTTGLLADERDVGSLANAVARIGKSEALSRSLTLAARDLVTREYDVRVQAARLLRVLDLAGHDRARTSC